MTKKRLTPIQSIKHHCKHQCCNGSNKDWKACDKVECSLYSYRLGHRPSKLPFETYCTKKHRDLTLNFCKNEYSTVTLNSDKTIPFDDLVSNRKNGKQKNHKVLAAGRSNTGNADKCSDSSSAGMPGRTPQGEEITQTERQGDSDFKINTGVENG